MAPEVDVVVSSDPAVVLSSDRVVLPGQGAIGHWMKTLQHGPESGSMQQAVQQVLSDRPVLGICLGLQALYASSSENDGCQCLGLLTGRVVHFRESCSAVIDRDHLKIPHMGWNRVHQTEPHPLWAGIEDGARFYFVHSYHGFDAAAAEVVGQTNYGIDFVSAAARENIFAVQFHPEKSAACGLQMLSNFVQWDGKP